jgi:hypothetical protein
LAGEGLCRFGAGPKGRETFDLAERLGPRAAAGPPDDPGGLETDDFHVLNSLEDREKALINFGVYETRVAVAELAVETGRAPAALDAALGRLEANQYLLRLEPGVVRSRMSEMARALKTAKQRFEQGDADSQPFQIRALRVETIERDKPRRNQPLPGVLNDLGKALAEVPEAAGILAALEPVLRAHWEVPAGEPVQLAAFQAESLCKMLPAYLEVSRDDTFVITADTGSGKTEAACLPLIIGAAVDVLRGRAGTKAVLVYPRIRLVYNQAQRLAAYLAALPRHGAPLLTLGVQTGDVPTRYGEAHYEEVWKPRPEGGYRFPFFRCPAPRCGRELALLPGEGEGGADRLACSCGWHYAGYVGTKEGLRRRPPDFFLPVTESLHNWLSYHIYGPLWGDGEEGLPPRAVLVDEIHLYSLVQGAQVGYLLRRLLARAYYNARRRDPSAPMPLAIGMSATLGNPRGVWATLTGRRAVVPIAARSPGDPDATEADPRGREYFYLVQPEVESRGHDVPGASATIQALLCLAHNMRRRPADRGDFRGLVFFDSLDRLKRLHGNFLDAEEAKHLAHLRTCLYDPDPLTGDPRTECCREPTTCAAFRSGECWYFAATDPHQVTAGGPYTPERSLAVLPRPIFSGAKGRVDEEIGRSDLVFTTSSLEVGFDDPAMILVYQHYAPANLASFIQRKGRGGRDTSDRPVTGVTLSLYSPRDTWYFRNPRELLHPESFESPLNMDNYFVRRGQATAALLDAVSRLAFRKGVSLPRSANGLTRVARLLDEREVDELVRLAMGPGIYKDLDVRDVRELWEKVLEARVPHPQPGMPPTWSDFLTWVPAALFDPINLPLLEVAWPLEHAKDPGTKQEEIALAFGDCAPGNATRRYGLRAVHWLYPQDPGDGPMLPAGEYDGGRHASVPLLSTALLEQTKADLQQRDALIRAHLPEEIRVQLQRPIDHRLFRPLRLPLTEVGRFRGQAWEPVFFWDPARRILCTKTAEEGRAAGLRGVDHRSRSRLRGFLLVHADPRRAASEKVTGLARLADRLFFYIGDDPAKRGTGLRVDRVFWGVDVRLYLTNREEEGWTRLFTSRNKERTLLHGYRLHTEGVQLTPDSRQLDAFVSAQEAELKREGSRSRWLRGQFFRYLLASRFAGRGLSSYAAGPIADLLVTANSDPELRPGLQGQRQQFDQAALTELLRAAFRRHLREHPLLTERRLTRHAEELGKAAFAEVFAHSLADVKDAGAFRRYLRSLVLHGLLLSLHESFVLHSRGDERRVLMHARLPIQFPGSADDTLSVFESGDHGDGSARTFRKHLSRAFAAWQRGELADCPHAAEDAVLELLFSQEGRHADWRGRDLRNPETVVGIGRELFGTEAFDRGLLQPVARVLFGSERIGPLRFALYDLHRDIRGVRLELESQLRRPAMAWELVSAAVERAATGSTATPHLAAWLRAYRALRQDVEEESHDPVRRLADQVYRLSATLCVDGCRGCLHRDSSLMPEEQVMVSVSRDLLQRYREFVLEPLTLRVGEEDGPPAAGEVERRVKEHGLCRVLVAPARYDGLRQELHALGFAPGRFDPLLRQVVGLRASDRATLGL